MKMPTFNSIQFEAVLFALKGQAILQLPEDASAKLPSRGQVVVCGTINGHELSMVLEPDGNRGHWMRIDGGLQKVAGIGVGDDATVKLEIAEDWPEPNVPNEFTAALNVAPQKVKDKWHEITPMARSLRS